MNKFLFATIAGAGCVVRVAYEYVLRFEQEGIAWRVMAGIFLACFVSVTWHVFCVYLEVRKKPPA